MYVKHQIIITEPTSIFIPSIVENDLFLTKRQMILQLDSSLHISNQTKPTKVELIIDEFIVVLNGLRKTPWGQQNKKQPLG